MEILMIQAQGKTVISGFHSPMEKECLEVLLRSPHPVIHFSARSWGGMHIRAESKKPLAKHYGFTDEELDFPPRWAAIINCDTHLRRGFGGQVKYYIGDLLEDE